MSGIVMHGLRAVVVVALVVSGLLLSPLAAAPAVRDSAFQAEFVASAGGGLQLRGLREVAGAPATTPRGEWRMHLLDETGATLAVVAVAAVQPRPGDPYASAPLIVRFSAPPAAILGELRDRRGALRAAVPLAAGNRAAAAASRDADQRRWRQAMPAEQRRAPDPAARASLQRQRDAAAAARARQQRDCVRHPPLLRPPEWIAPASGCAWPRLPDSRSPGPSRPRATALPTVEATTALPPERIDPRQVRARPREPRAVVRADGQLQFGAGAPAPTQTVWVFAYGADGNPGSWQALAANPPEFRFGVDAQTGATVTFLVDSPLPFVKAGRDVGPLTTAVAVPIAVARGIVLTGRMRYAATLPPLNAGNVVLWDADDTGRGWFRSPEPDGTFAFAVIPGRAPTLEINPASPYLAETRALGPLLVDTVRDFRPVPGREFEAGLTGPAQGQMAIIDLETGYREDLGVTAGTPLRIGVPARVLVDVGASEWRSARPLLPAIGAAPLLHVFAPVPLPVNTTLGVDVRDAGGVRIDQARIEVWQDGRWLTSAISQQGLAEFRLAPGSYRLRVWPDTEEAPSRDPYAPVRLFAEPAIVADVELTGARRDLQLQASPANWIPLRVQLPADPPWPACAGEPADSWGRLPFGRLELLRDEDVVARNALRAYYDAPQRRQSLVVGGGRFRLRYVSPGGKAWTSDEFIAGNQPLVTLANTDAASAPVWRGVLRDHAGNPLARRYVGVSDELGIRVYPTCPTETAADGSFQLPLCRGCVYEFRAVASMGSQRRIVRVDGPVYGDRVEDVRLDPPLSFKALPGTGSGRVFGSTDAPFRLVFLAEGYVAERETFTDVNGNGTWDGVHFIDNDGDGAWDEGEPWAVYGNAAAPVAGRNPRLGNEPFADANGDGVLSLDDAALFEQNVRDYLRGLFSSDQFGQYRNAYQAQAALAFSAQAGMDHPGLQQRDTLFGARFVVDRGLIEIDYGAAGAAAAVADPDYDVVVVMINQPVPYGRVNSFILASGGPLSGDVNDTVAAHEFGHNPGGLADEYGEFAGGYIGITPFGHFNASRLPLRDAVAWGNLLAPAQDGSPSKPWSGEHGLFEGAYYWTSGAFRPSQASMMRYMDSLLFNGASRQRLRTVHADALRGRAGLLTVVNDGCRNHRLQWDATAAEATSVIVTRGDPQGPVVGKGGATGTVRGAAVVGDYYLLDAVRRTVIDIEYGLAARCTGGAE